jgi:hypothetical protein
MKKFILIFTLLFAVSVSAIIIWDYNTGTRYDMTNSSDVDLLVEAALSGDTLSPYVSEDDGETFYNYSEFRNQQKRYLGDIIRGNNFTAAEFRVFLKENAAVINAEFTRMKKSLTLEKSVGVTSPSSCIFIPTEAEYGYRLSMYLYDNYGDVSSDVKEVQVYSSSKLIGTLIQDSEGFASAMLLPFIGNSVNCRIISSSDKILGEKEILFNKTTSADKSLIKTSIDAVSKFTHNIEVILNDYSGMSMIVRGYVLKVYRNREEELSAEVRGIAVPIGLRHGSNEFRYVVEDSEGNVLLEKSEVIYCDYSSILTAEIYSFGFVMEEDVLFMEYMYIGDMLGLNNIDTQIGLFALVGVEKMELSFYNGRTSIPNVEYVDIYYGDTYLFSVEVV